MIDLDQQSLTELKAIINQYLPNSEVAVVGSRARGTSKRYADIDLLIIRPSSLPITSRALLKTALEESNIPYRVDLIESDDLTDNFRHHLLVDAQTLK